MKNYLSYITRDNGFIMIHVLFVISLTFILVTSGIASYRNEILITDRQIEQIKIETLFQMGQAKYKQEQSASPSPILAANYDFPDGNVNISLVKIEEAFTELHFRIRFHDSDEFFPVNHRFVLDDD